MVYIVLFVIFIILNYGRLFEDYDEFNHWALIIKNMFLFNEYGTVENSIVKFNEYPPFTACFQYILLDIKGVYLEGLIIIAQNILYLSMVIPICEKVDFNKSLKKVFFIIPAILIVPIILYEDFFLNILVDGFLGILFAVGLFIIYKEDEQKTYKTIMLTLIITALTLTKTTGIFLAVLLFVFTVIKNKENRLKTILAISIIPIILTGAWYIKINKQEVPHEWKLEKTIQPLDESKNSTYSDVITKTFFGAMFEQNELIGKNLSLVCKVLVLSAYSTYLYKKITNKKQQKSYIHIIIETIISFILFAIGLIWMYITIFKPEEALIPASYDRYMNTILLTWLMLNTIIFCQENVSFSTIYIFIVIGIILLPLDVVQTKYIEQKQYKLSMYTKRNYYYSGLKKYINLFKEEDNIYFISDTTMNNYKILQLSKYQMMTENIKNEEPFVYESPENFAKTLLKENYTYVYIYRVEEMFKEKYKDLFSGPIKNETLYKVNTNENESLKLEKVK